MRIGKFSVSDYVLIEAFKDGITFDDIRYGVQDGKIIEEYPERYRCLVFSILPSKIYFHIVVDYFAEDKIDIISVYVPGSKKRVRGQYRKRGK